MGRIEIPLKITKWFLRFNAYNRGSLSLVYTSIIRVIDIKPAVKVVI